MLNSCTVGFISYRILFPGLPLKGSIDKKTLSIKLLFIQGPLKLGVIARVSRFWESFIFCPALALCFIFCVLSHLFPCSDACLLPCCCISGLAPGLSQHVLQLLEEGENHGREYLVFILGHLLWWSQEQGQDIFISSTARMPYTCCESDCFYFERWSLFWCRCNETSKKLDCSSWLLVSLNRWLPKLYLGQICRSVKRPQKA